MASSAKTSLPTFLGVRSMNPIPDMEIVTNYTGGKKKHVGEVEFFFRETIFAKYNVLETVRARLVELKIPYTYDSSAAFCGCEGQIFLTQAAYTALKAAWALQDPPPIDH